MHIKPIASNMTELHLSSGVVVLFSYETAVAAHLPGAGYVRTSQHYSKTTSRHINKWLRGAHAREASPESLQLLAEGADIHADVQRHGKY